MTQNEEKYYVIYFNGCYFPPLLSSLNQDHALLNRIESITTESERDKLSEISAKQKFTTTLMPIRTVGVQVLLLLQINHL